jgi:cytochrome c5
MIERVNMSIFKSTTLKKITQILLAAMVGTLTACMQGTVSEEPPIHINPNMDKQEKYKANAESEYFANASVNRMPVEGTVAREQLFSNTRLYYGLTENGDTLTANYFVVDEALEKRGEERYHIFCQPCHGLKGAGDGLTVEKGYQKPPTFHQPRLRNLKDGSIFQIITNGIKNMPRYDHQIPVKDRWAIVSYMKKLQRTHTNQ